MKRFGGAAGAPLWLLGLLSACDLAGPNSGIPVEFEAAPTVAPASATTPLAFVLSLRTNVPTSLEVSVSDGADHELQLAFEDRRQYHERGVIGLRPDRTYEMEVTARADASRSATFSEPIRVETPALPEGFPPIAVRVSVPEAMEPGYTLFTALSLEPSSGTGEDGPRGYTVIVDALGRVVWYTPTLFGDVRMLANGHLLGLRASGLLVEMSLLGEAVQTWHPAQALDSPPSSVPVDAASFHHEAFPLGTTSILVPTREDRLVENFPVDEHDAGQRETVSVRDEPIIEFERRGGTILNTWRLLDVLKPTRIGYDATNGLPDSADWAHVNAVIHDPGDDSIIVSLRSQDAVAKISRSMGELVWILGTHANWEGFERFLLSPVGAPFRWPYHQHAPEITPQGTLLLFDNGNYRASPFTGEAVLPASANWSRAVEYVVDEEAMTVRQLWEWGLTQSGEQLYAPFVGDADHLPRTNNVLISFAGICNAGGIPVDDIRACEISVRIIEVARNDSDRVVFDLAIADPVGGGRGWVSYRSERIASVYP